MWKPILAISLGSALGALLRWGLGTRLNSLFPDIPPGTLTANLIGGYIVGLADKHSLKAPFNRAVYELCKREFAKPKFAPLDIGEVWRAVQAKL